jgi:hypothetical protein
MTEDSNNRGEDDGVRPRLGHSPAARRAARSAATCSAVNTRPANASATASRKSLTSCGSDSTSTVSRSLASSPDGTTSAAC